MRYAVADLTGALLDDAVAKAEARAAESWRAMPYSSDWKFGGPIIERERIELIPQRMLLALDGNGFRLPGEGQAFYQAWLPFTDAMGNGAQYGETPLEAAMRAFVATKLGAEVDL